MRRSVETAVLTAWICDFCHKNAKKRWKTWIRAVRYGPLLGLGMIPRIGVAALLAAYFLHHLGELGDVADNESATASLDYTDLPQVTHLPRHRFAVSTDAAGDIRVWGQVI